MAAAPFRKILLIGATGSIGRYVLDALLAEPSLSVTILRRASSKNTSIPDLDEGNPKINIVTVPDSYPTDAVTSAFRGHDAVLSCLTSLSVSDQFRLIDAAIAAGVRRYMPSEFGLDNDLPAARALNAVFRDKGAVRDYLRAREDRIEWMAVSCGMWLRWSLRARFLGLHVPEGRVQVWDGGEGRLSVTTEENTAQAVVRALVRLPGDTRNRTVLVNDFVTTQRELVAEIERQLGKKLAVEEVDSRERIAELQAAAAAGDSSAVIGLVEAGFVTGRYGGDLEKGGEMMTGKLGLELHSLQEVVADALANLH